MSEITRRSDSPEIQAAPLAANARPADTLTAGTKPTIDDPPENPGPSVGGDPKPSGIRP